MMELMLKGIGYLNKLVSLPKCAVKPPALAVGSVNNPDKYKFLYSHREFFGFTEFIQATAWILFFTSE